MWGVELPAGLCHNRVVYMDTTVSFICTSKNCTKAFRHPYKRFQVMLCFKPGTLFPLYLLLKAAILFWLGGQRGGKELLAKNLLGWHSSCQLQIKVPCTCTKPYCLICTPTQNEYLHTNKWYYCMLRIASNQY